MYRREFLEKIGIGAAFLLTTICLSSCKHETVDLVDLVDFTIDLTAKPSSALKTNGGYMIMNNVVIARGIDGKYYAATIFCSHGNLQQVFYNKVTNRYECSAHQAQFDLAGKGMNENGSRGLKVYKTKLSNNTLRVYEG